MDSPNEVPADDAFERQLIARALAGDAEEARYALERCAEGVLLGRLSECMRQYLHDRLREIVDGIDPAQALRIARPAHRPRNPFPDWETPLAAFAALLEQRNRDPESIIGLMDEARQIIEGKSLERSEAQRIRRTYKPMRTMDDELLRHLMLHRRSQRGEPRSLGSEPRFPRADALALLALLDRD